MARYLGPKHKMCRRFGTKLCDSLKCPVVKRPYRPGQHGPKGSGHMSGYGIQLSEKQKARFIYGVLEKQFENYFTKATGQAGDTGQNLLRLLERRLDNVVFRSGVAQTRKMARQMVSHGHVLVNDKKVTIASYQIKNEDVISFRNRFQSTAIMTEAAKRLGKHDLPTWMTVASEQPYAIRITRSPEEGELQNLGIDPALIVEFYSR